MKFPFLLKIGVLLNISLVGLLFLNIGILQGGLFVDRLGIIPKRARLAAENGKESMLKKSTVNLKVKDFALSIKDDEKFFRQGASVDISCKVENTSAEPIKNFLSLIRTPLGEITSIKTKSLDPGEEITLEGKLTPENSGILIVACRTDLDQTIAEITENDNREVAAMYVLGSEK